MTSLNGVGKRRLAVKETSIDSCEPLDTLLFIYYYFLELPVLLFIFPLKKFAIYSVFLQEFEIYTLKIKENC